MPSVSSEIIADITDHIGKFGGDFTAWCVGTARDWHSAVLEAHEHEDKNDDFICREAYTPASARSGAPNHTQVHSKLEFCRAWHHNQTRRLVIKTFGKAACRN